MVVDGNCDLSVLLTCPDGVTTLPRVEIECGPEMAEIAAAVAAAESGGQGRRLQTLFDVNKEDLSLIHI